MSARRAFLAIDEPGTIGGRSFDGLFFFGVGLIAVAVGVLAICVRAAVMPLFVSFLLFVEGPHLVATWARTYLDASFRERRGPLLWGSLLWFLPGVFAWFASHAWGLRGLLDLFLLFAALWSFHHAVRQSHGVLAIYHHHGSASSSARVWDRRFVHGMLWLAFGVFSFGHPHNRAMFGLPDPLPPLLAWVFRGLLIVLLLSYLIYGFARYRRFSKEDPRPLLYLLGPAIGLQLFAMFVVGAFEPLVPRPEDPEQAFMMTTVVGGTVHGANYMAIIAAVGKRRYASKSEGSFASLLGRHPLYAYGVFVLFSLLYLAINVLRCSIPFVSVFSRGGWGSDFFLVLYWGFFFHHYYLDQKIWHVRQDKELRYELGLGGAA